MTILRRNAIASMLGGEAELLPPHPGIYYGMYPVGKPGKQNWLEKGIKTFRKSCRNIVNNDTKVQKDMLRRVEANYQIISALSDEKLDRWITDIKRTLHAKGLQDELMCRAFALIKEVSKRELGMAHYDCQVIGGWTMMKGMIAEMNTGEGKTLTATIPASCAGMANIPVHVITVNDYLVERDAELMRPVYQRLGLSVSYIVDGMDDETRRNAYRSDIVYCTSQQLVFDYLRDRMQLQHFSTDLDLELARLYRGDKFKESLLLRGLCFAVVDEVDSVFIDEAMTPLILSSKADNSAQEEIHREAIWLAKQFDNVIYYNVNKIAKQVTLTEHGERHLEELSVNMHGVWSGERRRKALVEQALAAIRCYKRDIQYIVDDGEVNIIDENTGRPMPDRSWEAGLHQLIEEKEGCEQSAQNQTIARISYQKFFSRYLKLAGMSGSVSEVSTELWRSYGLQVRKIPTHRPSLLIEESVSIYYTHEEKWDAVVADVAAHVEQRQPVLIGTRTVKDSEYISQLLTSHNCEHQVLNARHHDQEAEIVAKAGVAGRVTVATNMAGRGTDIKLDDNALEAGGLHVICCEKNDSRRIDRQLAGRCARQGDPGSYRVICSIEDDAVLRYFSRIVLSVIKLRNQRDFQQGQQVKPKWLAGFAVSLSQRMMEYYHHQLRKSMVKVDVKRKSMLAFTGQAE